MSVRPDGNRSIVEMKFEATPVSILAKVVALRAPLMAKQCRKAFEKDLDDLKRAAESGAGGAAVAAAAG